MRLEYLGHRDFKMDDGTVYSRECFVNPYSDKLYSIDTDIKETGEFLITDWDYSKKGLKIKKIRKFD